MAHFARRSNRVAPEWEPAVPALQVADGFPEAGSVARSWFMSTAGASPAISRSGLDPGRKRPFVAGELLPGGGGLAFMDRTIGCSILACRGSTAWDDSPEMIWT